MDTGRRWDLIVTQWQEVGAVQGADKKEKLLERSEVVHISIVTKIRLYFLGGLYGEKDRTVTWG